MFGFIPSLLPQRLPLNFCPLIVTVSICKGQQIASLTAELRKQFLNELFFSSSTKQYANKIKTQSLYFTGLDQWL